MSEFDKLGENGNFAKFAINLRSIRREGEEGPLLRLSNLVHLANQGEMAIVQYLPAKGNEGKELPLAS